MRRILGSVMVVAFFVFLLTSFYAKAAEAAAPAPAAPAAPAAAAPAPAKAGALEANPAAAAPAGEPAMAHGGGQSFIDIVKAGGPVGMFIWFLLFGNMVAFFYFMSDCAMIVRVKRVMPTTLVEKVTQAMEEGDVFKALKHCEDEPGPLANVLSAGFANVDQGFETIQDMVSKAAEMESEKLSSRVTYLNVVSNIGPLLGLLGTVHGMIFAFNTLAGTQAGAAQQAMLALNIAESLYCTATGLLEAIPALAGFYFFKNRATRIVLGMEALTLDLIKSLRNVEVVSE
ncbi:MAG: MotA/TolQ/ExbB proton channel family protein [Kiritimatiellae bacterium]|nr:MotA/TolQ/ExbB proton channel family protein [Kiritimatiellia bacterium]MDD5519176.1 MotA/TolQ/ExbB proton channel family protein [Kiritimatiellia bacterium]